VVRPPDIETHSLLPSSLYLGHSHGPVLAPATLAAFPSTRAIPNRDVFCVADPISSIHSERFLRLFAGTHDRGRPPACPSARSQALRRSCIISGLRFIRSAYESFGSLRLRGGHGFPCLSAARFISRIATIWRACDLVSSRRLARPPRFPISARYSRILFCACVISLQCSTNSAS
jgi:hypothetical protein